MEYAISTVEYDEKGTLKLKSKGKYRDKVRAMKAAKVLAQDAGDCQCYGPSAICYIGSKLTAVIAW